MAEQSPRRSPSLLSGLALSFVTVLLCLLAGEIWGRLRSPSASLWSYPNYIWLETHPTPEARGQLVYDEMLGYRPRAGFSGTLLGHRFSVGADGLRAHNVAEPRTGTPSILALGDSYTEGYAVADDETWPAHLERDTGRRVMNGGVRSYGIDQMILRGEGLVPELKPGTVILAFNATDIIRTAYSEWDSHPKPYFVPAREGLELRGIPVARERPKELLDPVRRVLGYSYLLDTIMVRLRAHELWYGGLARTGQDETLVSCRLMQRFADLVRRERVKGLVVAFERYEDWVDRDGATLQHSHIAAVLDCAGKAGLPTLNTYDAFVAAGVPKNLDAFYDVWHFNDRTSALAARLIGERLKADGL